MGISADHLRGLHLSALSVLLGAFAAAALGVLHFHELLPSSLGGLAELVTSCPYSTMTRTPCPLCGTVRALSLLVGGELCASLAMNPLAAALLPAGVIQVAYRAIRVVRPSFRWQEELPLLALGLLPIPCLALFN
jgi:hypothetical protein